MGKPLPSLVQDGHRRVVHRKKARAGLVDDVQRERHAQPKPGAAETRRRK